MVRAVRTRLATLNVVFNLEKKKLALARVCPTSCLRRAVVRAGNGGEEAD